MKTKLLLALAVSLFSFNGLVAQEENEKTQTAEPAWIDMANCEICQHFKFMEDQMMNIKWETYILENGLMSVSVLPEDLKKPMAEAKEGMQETIARIESGEEVKCCPFCQSMGSMIASGAKMQEISTIAGEVQLITSDDPKIVEQIHAHAKKTIKFHKTMMHELHKHDSHDKDGKNDHDKDGHEHDNDGSHGNTQTSRGG